MPTSKDFTYTRAPFNLLRNVMSYHKLRECRLQVSHVFVIYRHETHSRIILCTCSLENNAVSVLHYVKKVTLHYLTLHRFEIHSALELSRTALLCYCLAVSRLRETARQHKFLETKSFFFALYTQYIPPFHMCRRTFQCLTALYWFKLQIKRVPNKSIRWVQLLFNFVDLTKTMQLSAFMHSNYMYQGFKAIMHFQTIINNRNYCRAGKTQVWLQVNFLIFWLRGR